MKQKFVNSGLVIGSIIFSLLALEIGFRSYKAGREYQFNKWAWEYQFINFRRPPPLPLGSEPKFVYPAEFDTELGWVPRQGVWGPTVIFEDGIRSNGNGEVPDPTEAILAVGDSFTYGDEVSDWETWPAQLEKLTGRKVINGGVFGYGIDQAFLRARQLLSRYRFSTVIFSFIPDDIQRCQMSERYWNKPYFDFRDGRLTLENAPVSPPAEPPKEGKLLIALEHSLLVHAVMRRLFPEWWLGQEVQVQDKEKGIEVACALLHEVERLTETRGYKLIILVQYWPQDVVSESTSMTVDTVLRCLSEPATRVLDLKPALYALNTMDPSRFNRLYTPGGWHMTAEGNQLVALEISKFLTQGSPKIHQSRLSPAR